MRPAFDAGQVENRHEIESRLVEEGRRRVELARFSKLQFTDANAFFRPDAIRRLVEPFSDPRVGLVCGRLRYVPDAGSFMTDEELYWRYEDVIKSAEGRAGRLLVGNGSIYALRAELFRPIPGSVADDFATPLLVAAAGHRLVYAPEAVAEERLPAQGVENFRAKARIVTRGATALRIYWREALRSGPLRVAQYLLHKVARWLMGLVLAALFFVSLAGASHPLLATALTAQVAFYLLGVAAYLLARRGPVPGVLRLPFYFLLVNAAALAGLLEFALGRRRVIWEKSETTRRSPDEEIALARPHEHGVPVGRPFSRRAAVLVTVALVGAGLLAAETGARLTYGMRDGLRALRGAVPPKGTLRFYEVPDRVHPGNWLLRPGVSVTLQQLSAAAGARPEPSIAQRARALGVAPGEVVFRVNERGYKGPPLAAPGERPRILAVGDSCAFGSLIDRYSYPRVLERELAPLGTPAEVVNVGVSGYYPAHVLARIEEFAALAPDISLICIGWNALYGERYTPTTLIDRMYLLRVATALGGRWRSWGTTPHDIAEERSEKPRRLDPGDPEIERLSRYTPPFVDDVRRIGERLRAAGSRVFVLTLPSLYLSGERPTPEALEIGTLPRFTDNPYVLAAAAARYNQLLRELTDESGFEVIDLASWNRESLRPRHALLRLPFGAERARTGAHGRARRRAPARRAESAARCALGPRRGSWCRRPARAIPDPRARTGRSALAPRRLREDRRSRGAVRVWLRRLLEWLGVAALSLLVAEVALRFVLDVQPLTPGQFVFEAHPTRGWTHRAGAVDEYVKIGTRQEIRINSLGLRERELARERTPGTWRVLVIGDSQVAGFEVAQDATFTRVAERVLRERGHEVEIINGGFRGYGTDQVLLFLREDGVRYRPDVVLYVWAYNDPEDNMTIHRPFRRFGKGWFDLDAEGRLTLRGTPVPEYPHAANLKVGEDGKVFEIPVPLLEQAGLWLRDLTVTRSSVATAVANIAVVMPFFWQGLRGVAAYEDFQPVLERDTRLFRVTEALIREMERTAREAGAEFALVGAEGLWGDALRDSLGLRDLPVLARFRRSLHPGDKVIVPFDSHLNTLGHKLYGEALAEVLLESRLAGPASDGSGAGASAGSD